MENDLDFQDTIVVGVTDEEGGWAIEQDQGWHFYVPKSYGVEPKVGQTARFYPGGIGRMIRGLVIDGQVLYYRTEAEERERFERELAERNEERKQAFEENRADHDQRIAALPEVFQRRIAKFQHASPDFRWKHEGYELMCCEQAVMFAEILKNVEAIGAFREMSWEEQKVAVPGLDDGHSGNSFDFSCRLARSYLTEPELVYLDHGALVLLTGCEEYGCPHPVEVTA